MERLGVETLDLVCLICNHMDESLLESAWVQMGALVASGKATLVGIRCRNVVQANIAFSKGPILKQCSGVTVTSLVKQQCQEVAASLCVFHSMLDGVYAFAYTLPRLWLFPDTRSVSSRELLFQSEDHFLIPIIF